MAFTPPALKSVNTMITASDWNTLIRDNFEAGVPGLFAARGDLAVGAGPQQAVRLAVGANGQTLQVDTNLSNYVGWALFNRARAGRAAQTSLGNAATTVITFDTEYYDAGAMFNPASQVITIPRTGLYRIAGYARILPNGQTLSPGEQIQFHLRQNGQTWAYLGFLQSAAETYTNTGAWTFHGVIITHVAAGNTFGLSVYHNLGGTLIIPGGSVWLEVETL